MEGYGHEAGNGEAGDGMDRHDGHGDDGADGAHRQRLLTVAELLDRDRKRLPASPQVLLDLDALLRKPTAGAADVGRLLERDPALVAMVLSLVNSAYYGLRVRIVDPRLGVAYLGVEEVHRLVVAATIAQSFRNVPATRLRAHWTFAHLTALVARSLAGERMPWLSRSAAWASGLLHDVGELVRWQIDREGAERLAEYRAHHHCLPEEAEVAVELTPGPLYAAALCRVWDLPGPFEIVCRSHRTGVAPTSCRRDTVDIVRVVAAASNASRVVLDKLNPAAEAEAIARIEDILVTDRAGIDALLALTEGLRTEAERAVSTHMMPLAV